MKQLGRKLGRKLGILALCAALATLNAAPAFARGVGVDVDGRTYTFYLDGGSTARYEIDGKTFLIGEDEVIVQEPGKPERRFPLGDAVSADASATDAVPGNAVECVSEVTVTSDDDAEGVHYIIKNGASAQETTSANAESVFYISEGGATAQGSASASDEDLAEGTYYISESESITPESASASAEDAVESVYYISEDGAIIQESASPSAEGTAEGAYYISEGGAIASESASSSAEDATEFAAYAPYGLSCDAAGKLYYLGEPVRVFEDDFRVDGGIAETDYFDADGTVDVRSIRDERGALTGLEALSEAEFAARDLREWTNPAPPAPAQMESTATSGSEPTPEERAAFFAPYAPFGLRYDAAADKLYVNGRPVRNFLDVRRSNGESPTGGNFRGTMTQLHFEGEVDVTIQRDYSQPDEAGEGKIIGIEVAEAK